MRSTRVTHRPLPGAALVLVLAALAGGLGLAGCTSTRELAEHREESLRSAVLLAPQAALTLETRSADVNLVASPDDSVHVLTFKLVRAFSRRSLDEMWRQIRVTMERSGKDFVLRVYEPDIGSEHVTVSFGPYRFRRAVDIRLTVAVPRGCPVTVRGDRGDVTAFGLRSDLVLDVRSGAVQLSEHTGGVDVETASGEVKLDAVSGPAHVRTRSGDVEADSALAGVEIRTASGDVSVTRSLGPFGIETSSGDVQIKNARGSASVRTSSGGIELYAIADTLLTESASGDQTLDLLGPPRKISAQSTSGDVSLSLPEGSGGQFDAETSNGAISVTSSIRVDSASRRRLSGNLGGPGATWVHTSTGDISVTAASASTAAQSGGDSR